MAQGKFTENLIRLRCSQCKRTNYTVHKNKKTIERKLELKKYCPWCRKHTLHKESKK
ncbi:50S ribosomal protein L33 [Candidatus Jorgensenbacteria bacterium CG_4_10_14_0_8_um_filter_39_13]|uniref:Large ribosomal subunit protein bL33 n=1 Tax=Candidatus Jorgensenbacteria bacterium CG_4_10_14_0_8_um_filter_39_13 TaxID=1974589 RepID=A0A2M7RIG6_9BACT|nr:MAG: 50S ribosomal protein L33 [Candidatus Jorgensenbacteria bacterium CG03_land_8_20_14_0_80_38_39]PIW97420.1 MAG: 50S ribosomal protein L33 [Candidatus Jorgensenbacteria bacterium CG_4_8_14_3_um_filter_38_10]PIY96494.1 MAG: 50S ribosomal protein L33 [Candidatus Jorgensenbacteria bacterium CG_4_10_14_0_8_um_filter_39_13]